ncbi:DUF423 domain-containing protein [Paracandidimonas lactea]|uniref:DUF423 domain-containing protein n=1 Tax=Paracandidimonas lactea TaxID=2895524 RepID=UPI001F36C1D0|nr:DUF423 domain-containing protein [Paracandidimonas lactea]
MPTRHVVTIAAILMLLGVAAGAFGAHGLKRVVSTDMLGIWHTAVLYQLVHGLGMLLAALLAQQFGSALFNAAATVMLAGVLIFSGSLYALVLTGATWLGAITPIGGMAFLAGWGILAWAAVRST